MTPARRDLLSLAALGVTALALRIPFLPAYDEDLDTLRFRLAVERFDITELRPHAPFYPVYLAVAKLIAALGASPRAALGLICSATGAALLIFTTLLASEILGRRAARLAALFALALPRSSGSAPRSSGSDSPASPSSPHPSGSSPARIASPSAPHRFAPAPSSSSASASAYASPTSPSRSPAPGSSPAPKAAPAPSSRAPGTSPPASPSGSPRSSSSPARARSSRSPSRRPSATSASGAAAPSPSRRPLRASTASPGASGKPPRRRVNQRPRHPLGSSPQSSSPSSSSAPAAPSRCAKPSASSPSLAISMIAYFAWALLGQNTAGKPRHWLPLLPLLILALAAGTDTLLTRARAAIALPLLLAAEWLTGGAALVRAHRNPPPGRRRRALPRCHRRDRPAPRDRR